MNKTPGKSKTKKEKTYKFQTVYKKNFFIERLNVPSPIPSQNIHYHEGYELYYLYGGERYYFIKDKTYHVESGSLVLINKGDIHSTSNFAHHGYDRVLINFKDEFIKELLAAAYPSNPLECFENSNHTIVLNPKEKVFIESLFESMLSHYDPETVTDNTYLKFSLMQLLLFIDNTRRHPVSEISSYANSTHKTISEITSYINNHYRENITLDSISNMFYLSPCYFSRTFKKVCGMPFSEYLNNVRVKEARKLLNNTDMSVTTVATAVGFGSNAHFDRVFKRLTGMSPLSFKKASKDKK